MSVQEVPQDLMFYLSGIQSCSYLAGEKQLNLFADPHATMTPELYSVLCELGFRRSGEFVYTPRCPACQACLPVRVPVSAYQPRRRQRRNWLHNQDLQVRTVSDEFREEHFALYQRYIQARHEDGSMAEPTPEQYHQFFYARWSDTRLVEFRCQQRLLGVAVVDLLRDGLSAVYSFFDPEEKSRGLGVYMVQWLIAETQHRQLPYLYLGYLVRACRKMAYKEEYQPLQAFIHGQWQTLVSMQSKKAVDPGAPSV